MRALGILLIVMALAIGYQSGNVIDQLWIERVVGIAFFCFLFGMFILIKTSNCRFTRKIPSPPEHLRPKKKCICNDIGKHSPGGRCEADHSVTPKRYSSNGIEIPEFPKDRT